MLSYLLLEICGRLQLSVSAATSSRRSLPKTTTRKCTAVDFSIKSPLFKNKYFYFIFIFKIKFYRRFGTGIVRPGDELSKQLQKPKPLEEQIVEVLLSHFPFSF